MPTEKSQSDMLADALEAVLCHYALEPIEIAWKVLNEYKQRKRQFNALEQQMKNIAHSKGLDSSEASYQAFLDEASERNSKHIDDNIDVYKRLADR
jgi:DNA topoisomerase IB